jgi:hypothetical protein
LIDRNEETTTSDEVKLKRKSDMGILELDLPAAAITPQTFNSSESPNVEEIPNHHQTKAVKNVLSECTIKLSPRKTSQTETTDDNLGKQTKNVDPYPCFRILFRESPSPAFASTLFHYHPATPSFRPSKARQTT